MNQQPEEEGTEVILKRRKREKFIRRVPCQVCQDTANDHVHYGATACYSCRAFFRRCQVKISTQECNNKDNNCQIDKVTRRLCQCCRYKKCLAVGMNPHWVMSEQDKKEKKEKATEKAKVKCNLTTQYEQRRRYSIL